MMTCFQFEGMSVLDHGYDVHMHFLELYDYLAEGRELGSFWKLPSWFDPNKDLIATLLLSLDVIRLYHIYHDCGKPQCRVVDDEGRQHFPNHADVSSKRWLECGGGSVIAELIARDMDMHTISCEAALEFSKRPDAITLLLTALSEIHSNSKMFGGTDSVSFKIKFKKIERLGKTIINSIKERSVIKCLHEESKCI